MAIGLAGALTACSRGPTTATTMPDPVLEAPQADRPPPERLDLRLLLVAYEGAEGARNDQKRTREQAQERAWLLSQMAKGQTAMAELAREYSDWRGAADDSGMIRVETAAPSPLDEAVIEAALGLGTGQISDPIHTPQGYFVVQRLQDPPVGPERIGAKHILIAYAGSPQKVTDTTRTEAEARELAQRIAEQAKGPDADWDALAAEHTDEPGSQETGGDLGRFGRGQMVGAFERAAFALEVGEISEPVQSPFGFHVIQRYE